MNKEKQRIAIAEACGLPKPYSTWSVPNTGDTLCHSVTVENGLMRAKPIPDYLNDLNAINDAVLSILNSATSQLNWDYCRILGGVTGSGNHVTTAIIHATAAQRAEALLKTLNLWEDE